MCATSGLCYEREEEGEGRREEGRGHEGREDESAPLCSLSFFLRPVGVAGRGADVLMVNLLQSCRCGQHRRKKAEQKERKGSRSLDDLEKQSCPTLWAPKLDGL